MTLETELNVFKQTLGYGKYLESQIQKLRLEKKGRNEIKVDGIQKRNRMTWQTLFIFLEIQTKLLGIKGRIDLDRSLIRTIEEKQANNEENISLIKKQVKKAREKVVEMEERQRRAIM